VARAGNQTGTFHIDQGYRVRLIWAHIRLEFGVVRPNILFGRTGATENVSGIIYFYFFTEQSIHNIVMTTEEAVMKY
jgi:hypothetical protein